MARWLCLVGPLACLLVLGGCGKSESTPEPVSGTVLLDGKPLPEGTILFSTTDGKPPASGPIKEGKFEFQASPGTKKVEISSLRSTGKPASSMYTADQAPEMVNIIPPRFNRESTLTAEVKPGDPNEFKFEVQSK